MTFIRERATRHSASWIGVFILVLAACGSALGKDQRDPSNDNDKQPVRVVAHLNLPGPPVDRMLLQEREGHQYLYLIPESGKNFTVLDVTQPDKPSLTSTVSLPKDASDTALETFGNRSVIAEEPSGTQAASSTHQVRPESLQLLDLTDPANPQIVKSFSNVTSVLADDGRRLVYVAIKNDGLYVLQRRSRSTTYPCMSEDPISVMPECD